MRTQKRNEASANNENDIGPAHRVNSHLTNTEPKLKQTPETKQNIIEQWFRGGGKPQKKTIVEGACLSCY